MRWISQGLRPITQNRGALRSAARRLFAMVAFLAALATIGAFYLQLARPQDAGRQGPISAPAPDPVVERPDDEPTADQGANPHVPNPHVPSPQSPTLQSPTLQSPTLQSPTLQTPCNALDIEVRRLRSQMLAAGFDIDRIDEEAERLAAGRTIHRREVDLIRDFLHEQSFKPRLREIFTAVQRATEQLKDVFGDDVFSMHFEDFTPHYRRYILEHGDFPDEPLHFHDLRVAFHQAGYPSPPPAFVRPPRSEDELAKLLLWLRRAIDLGGAHERELGQSGRWSESYADHGAVEEIARREDRIAQIDRDLGDLRAERRFLQRTIDRHRIDLDAQNEALKTAGCITE